MSCSQYYETVGQNPKPEDLDSPNAVINHFVFDYPTVFGNHFPTAIPLRIAYILGWEFHINEIGRANIRPVFNTKFHDQEPVTKEYLMPVQGRKGESFDIRMPQPVYGVIFAVSREDDRIIEQSHRLTRVSCHSTEFSREYYINGGAISEEVSVFADLLHTRDGYKNPDLISQDELERWMATLRMFQHFGVPDEYLIFLWYEVGGEYTDKKLSPIYVDPQAYPKGLTRHLGADPAIIPKADSPRLPLKALQLEKQYFRKHGVLALPPPRDDHQAMIFEDYHDALLLGKVQGGSKSSERLKSAADYFKQMSGRCDDGLDFLDAIKESRGEGPWRHPNAVGKRAKAVVKRKATAVQPKPGPKDASMKPPPRPVKGKPVPKFPKRKHAPRQK